MAARMAEAVSGEFETEKDKAWAVSKLHTGCASPA